MSKFGLVVLGAHIGIHIKGDIEKLSPEKVLLVEPVPHNVAAIKKNLIHLDNVIIEQVAISNKNEIIVFFVAIFELLLEHENRKIYTYYMPCIK